MKNSTDKKIIMLLQTDAEEGMSLLMEQYMGLLWSACRLHLDNPEDIRECIQETLTDFYEQRNHFDLDKGTLKAYLYVIAKRKAIRMSLRHDHKADELDDLKYKENEDWIEELAVQSLLEDALSKLDEQDSQIIRMRYYNGMTCKEIAHCMNLPVETVKKRNQRSLMKLRKILIAVCILGLLTACAVKIVYNYRFSKLTGFQQDDEDIWYTMVEEPMTIRTEQGDVVVRSVVWKEETVFAEFEFLNHQLRDDDIQVFLYWEDENRPLSAGKCQWTRGEDMPITLKCVYEYQNAREMFVFQIFGERYEVHMEPIAQLEDFEEIGISQTHRGRTIVLCEESGDEGEKLNAYVHSEDIWKITFLGRLTSNDWTSYDNPNRAYFSYTKENMNSLKTIDIDSVVISAECEDVKVPLNISSEYMETDIPFMIGEDKYSIKSIWISESTFEYGVGSTDEDTVIEYGNEVMIKVEPVNIEENTRVMMIKASVGTEKERLVQVFKSSTGETELKNLGYEFNVIETNAFGQYFFDKNYEPTEIVLKFGFQKDENIPEELILRIDQVGKIWDQNYYFELD